MYSTSCANTHHEITTFDADWKPKIGYIENRMSVFLKMTKKFHI